MLRILLIFYLPLLSVFLFSGRQKLINDSVLELPNKQHVQLSEHSIFGLRKPEP